LETMRNGAIGLKIFIIIPKFTWTVDSQ
jgi:hypothetical protein